MNTLTSANQLPPMSPKMKEVLGKCFTSMQQQAAAIEQQMEKRILQILTEKK